MLKFITLMLVLCLAISMNAQLPEKISYQAVIRTADGNMVRNSTIGIRINILQDSPTGTIVYTETHTAITNTNGLVTLQIGTGVTTDDFTSILWKTGIYYLKTETDPLGGTAYTITGTSQLLSVPYALYAKQVQNNDDADADPANEIQTLSLIGKDLSISGTGGNIVTFSNWDSDATDDVLLAGNQSISGNKAFTGTVTVNTPVNSSDAVNKEYVDNIALLDAWRPIGNTGTDPTTDFIGTTDSQPIVFRVNNSRKMVLNENGNLAFENTGSSVFIGNGAGKNDDLTDNKNVFIGDSSGFMNTTGYHNTVIGISALKSNTSGYSNIAIGYSALNSNTTGYINLAFGNNALKSNTTGVRNVAIGSLALYYNNSGMFNVGIGHESLSNNTEGKNNTSIGDGASKSNTTGSYNTAAGYGSLGLNTTGSKNTAYGNTSLFFNTTGNANTALGESALCYNTTGYSNVAVGTRALFQSTARSNIVAIGDSALFNNEVGALSPLHSIKNTAVGSKALFSNTVGHNNTAAGYQAMYNNSEGYSNTAYGSYALRENSTGAYITAVGMDALYNNTNGFSNVAFGYQALYENTTGDYNTAVGRSALDNNITGNNNTAIGYYAGPSTGNLTNTTTIGYGASVSASNTIRLGNSMITSIGGYAPWTNLSDGRFKTKVTSNVPGLEFIMKLNPVTFNWDLHKLDKFLGVPDNIYAENPKMEKDRIMKEAKITTGFIAQEVETAAKECGYDFSGIIKPENEKSHYNLSYAEFVVPLVKAVQEQQSIINKQQQMIEGLMKEIEKLKSEK